ncbi:uncharacterized protein BYT42DRAFT_171125 [Radiomyces spectabilis]|uniref:uncharacterized protein n=1 Tax=Radiomyces spectabilis TaxID=64574 RepID=UPI002220196A|nr:uncharacterized protein BYT42DRAFT_171125 [Radiomyces spectabilis]KAI8390822.1 hypothetical protein BYT42DRAFT_171125 [Radiomyces spectabilis]
MDDRGRRKKLKAHKRVYLEVICFSRRYGLTKLDCQFTATCHHFNYSGAETQRYCLFQSIMSIKVVNPNYSRRSEPAGGFQSLEAFYPFYLGEHCDRTNRRLHIIGSTISLAILLWAAIQKQPSLLWVALVQGYGFAWIGHFVFEKNKPATFRYPIWSFICDFKLWSEVLSGKRAF